MLTLVSTTENTMTQTTPAAARPMTNAERLRARRRVRYGLYDAATLLLLVSSIAGVLASLGPVHF